MKRLLLVLVAGLTGCSTPITTPDQMRDAVLAGRARAVGRAVARGFPVEADVIYCFPLVPFAAATGHTDVVTAVLDQRPSAIDQPNCMGHTALHFAVMTANAELERALARRAANADARDRANRRPEDLRPRPPLPARL